MLLRLAAMHITKRKNRIPGIIHRLTLPGHSPLAQVKRLGHLPTADTIRRHRHDHPDIRIRRHCRQSTPGMQAISQRMDVITL